MYMRADDAARLCACARLAENTPLPPARLDVSYIGVTTAVFLVILPHHTPPRPPPIVVRVRVDAHSVAYTAGLPLQILCRHTNTHTRAHTHTPEHARSSPYFSYSARLVHDT